MYKLKILVALESDKSPCSFEATTVTLAWYDSIQSKSLVEVLEGACDVDDFLLRNCLFSPEEVLEKHHRGFFENLLASDSLKKK